MSYFNFKYFCFCYISAAGRRRSLGPEHHPGQRVDRRPPGPDRRPEGLRVHHRRAAVGEKRLLVDQRILDAGDLRRTWQDLLLQGSGERI